ncbi:MAG: tRNA (guanosine(46)-N7)-methyltransferase TrmB [Planctomycetaceae bacterium]
MPRRQLPKLNPSIVLDAHLRNADTLPEVITSESLFGKPRPLELEIGSGKGLFIQNSAMARPHHHFVGVEIAKMYAAHAASRLASRGLDNAIMVCGDAQRMLLAIPDGSLIAVHIYFPDPWWKKKHKKRRVVNEPSVAQIYRALAAGGTLHFWTDVLEYFESAIEMIAERLPEFGPPLPEEADEDEASDEIAYRTHFERRSVRHEIPVYRVRFVKSSG